MATSLQVLLILAVLFYLAVILSLLKKGKLTLRYSLLWLISGVVMLFFAIFPKALIFLAKASGFEVASNGLFAICLFLVIMLLVYMTTVICDFSLRIKTLTQKMALLEKQVQELNGKGKSQ